MASQKNQMNSQMQAQQQQDAVRNAPSVPHSTASTSKLRAQNGGTSQQSSRGVEGIARSEPPRAKPSYPAPSTIMPDDSISVRGSQTIPNKQNPVTAGSKQNPSGTHSGPRKLPVLKSSVASRPSPQTTPHMPGSTFSSELWGEQTEHASSSFRPTPQYSVGGNTQPSLCTPISANKRASSSSYCVPPGANDRATPSQRSAPTATNIQYPASSSRSNLSGNNHSTTSNSTARAANQNPSGHAQSSAGQTASVPMTGTFTESTRQARPATHSNGLFQSSSGPQPSPGINIGVPPAAQMHFHYNQVDNRQLHINNNAPQNVVTNNNQVYTTDNSNHHNTHAPQANTYSTHAANVGNTHTNVTQKATTARPPASSSGNGQRREVQPPSESMALRGRQYTRIKHTSFNEWTDKRSVTYEEVPDDRSC